MRRLGLSGYVLTIGATAVLLTGCRGSQPPIGTPGAMPQSGVSVPQVPETKMKRPNLYVVSSRFFNAHSSVKVYAPGSTRPLRTISQGVSNPVALAFNGSGDLYVANAEILYGKKWGPATISVYAPGSSAPSLTISEGVHAPTAMAFDHAGNLYVVMAGANKKAESVTVYAPGSTKVLRRITAGLDVPTALAFDRSNNLYVANLQGSTITVYAPGSTSVLRKIDVNGPADLRFSPSGNLFVASDVIKGRFGGRGSIKVYYPGGSSPHRTISTTNGYCAYALRFDGSGNLYTLELECGDLYYGVADEYASGGSSVLRSISENGLLPRADAIDSAENLYVADCNSCWGLQGKDSVRVYAPGRTSPFRRIFVRAPLALAFGP